MWPILLYGCEYWTVNADLKNRLEANELGFIRRLLRIAWKDKKSNEIVLKEVITKRASIETGRRSQLQFKEHLNGHKGLEHVAVTGKIDGKRSVNKE